MTTIVGPRFGKRHIQVALMFCLLSIAFAMRMQLSEAMVAMTSRKNPVSPNPDVKLFDWDNQSVLLSTFWWGYPWLQILAANLGRVYGTKYFLIGAMVVNSTFCCLVPFFTIKWDSTGLIVIRILQGLSQGFFYPSCNNLLSVWSPVSERATLGNIVYSGAFFGTIITMPLVSLFSTTWYGWPLSFYVYGVVGYLWAIAFYFFGASFPSSHRHITVEEKEYIEKNLDSSKEKMNIPWLEILKNRPFWAVFVVQVGQFFCNLILMLETPLYLFKVMNFDIEWNGILSAAPNVASFLFMIIFGTIGDYLINKDIFKIQFSRKFFTTIGSLVPATSLLILAFSPKEAKVLSVFMLILAAGSASACGSGAVVNHIDLSPNFAGVLLGIINTSGTFVSITGPLAVQVIVTDETDKDQWKIIFCIAAAVYVMPWVIYTIFASAEVQKFDGSPSENIIERKERLKKHSVISIMSM
ncbi:unnamed protein product [Phyllotreta striolata]|uniref:Major facilitator superfamily (MFS) profile domain-containing protein n=1 Tax=Phyllotreta striolata TaxID=444603 RepID=A0A9N9XS12_PHYSR|nr:unnamed protein product [Phyllotreta striolata]